MSKKDDIIVDLLGEVRDEQKAHSTILIELQHDVSRNTDDLEKHIEGVVQNRKRIVELEKPGQAFSLIKKYIIGLGAIAGAIYAILKVTDYL